MMRLKSLFNKFRQSSSGVAAVEFALILPIMLLMFLGSIELGDLILVNKRVSVVSESMGDLVARTDTTLTTATLNDYFEAVSTTMTPYDATALKQIVTCVFVDADGNTSIVWSRGYNGGTAHAVNGTYNIPAEFIALSKNRYVIVAEAKMAYLPMFGYALKTGFNLYRDSFYLPRFGGLISTL